MFYYALIHKDEGSSYGVSFPDIPGCFSSADKIEDIESNAIEALSLWFEDETPMAQRAITELQSDSEVKAQLAEGAFLLAVPHIPDDTKVMRINVTMPKGLLDTLDEAAEKRKTTRSGLIATAVKELIAV